MCGFQNVTEKIDLLKVSEKLLEGKELEFVRWEGDAQDLLKGVREKLNVLGEVRSVNAIMTTLPSDKTIISFSQFVFFFYTFWSMMKHWTRDEKNKCLKETAKAFKYMGQIVRLIVL